MTLKNSVFFCLFFFMANIANAATSFEIEAQCMREYDKEVVLTIHSINGNRIIHVYQNGGKGINKTYFHKSSTSELMHFDTSGDEGFMIINKRLKGYLIYDEDNTNYFCKMERGSYKVIRQW